MFTLPNKIIEIKFIPRERGIATGVKKDHVISGGMLNKAVKRYTAPLQRNGTIKNILTSEEKEYLEKITGLNLSIYNEDFWINRSVPLYKEEGANILNLSDPVDYISYKILLSNTNEISPSWAQRNNNLGYLFAITDSNQELEERKSKRDISKEAMRKYFEIETNKELLLVVARIMSNNKLSDDSAISFLQDIVEERLKSNPNQFLSIVNDPKMEIKGLLFKAVSCEVVNVINGQYETAEGLKLCEQGEIATLDVAAEYLSDPSNREIRDLIEGKINSKNKPKKSK